MSTKTNYICYKLITNIKKGDLSGCFLPSKISDLVYSKETLVLPSEATPGLLPFRSRSKECELLQPQMQKAKKYHLFQLNLYSSSNVGMNFLF